MDVSIIICTFNRCENLRQTLQSCCEMEIPSGLHWELLVVDNHSNDATKQVCETFTARLPIRYLFEPRQGKGNALNTAVQQAAGSLLIFTDDDVRVDRRWVASQMTAAGRHPEASFFGGKVLPIWESKPPRWAAENLGWLHINVHVDQGNQEGNMTQLIRDGDPPFFAGANLACRKQLFEDGYRFHSDTGPTGSDLTITGHLRGEDTDLLERLLRAGHTGIYVPNAIVYHRHAAHRQTEKYLRHWYHGYAVSEIRRSGKLPAGRYRFGAPQYLWKQLVLSTGKYIVTRWTCPSRTWLSAERKMASAWGSICECRRIKQFHPEIKNAEKSEIQSLSRPRKTAAAPRGERLGLALVWRWRALCLRFDRILGKMGTGWFINFHWPWPVHKPFQRKSVRLRAPGRGIGDELMCTPIFREIKRRNPHCQITFESRHSELFSGNPNLNSVEPCSEEATSETIQLAYHHLIPPPRSLISIMAETVGLRLSADQLDCCRPPDSEILREIFGDTTPPFAVIQTSASDWTPNKDWPREHWVDFVRRLSTEMPVIEVGTTTALSSQDHFPEFHSFVSRTTLSEFAYIISRAAVFIGPVSSGMHLANAFDVPSVIIYGGYESPTGHAYPRTTAFFNSVECAPCWLTTMCPYDHKCLRMISTDQVLAAVRQATQAVRTFQTSPASRV